MVIFIGNRHFLVRFTQRLGGIKVPEMFRLSPGLSGAPPYGSPQDPGILFQQHKFPNQDQVNSSALYPGYHGHSMSDHPRVGKLQDLSSQSPGHLRRRRTFNSTRLTMQYIIPSGEHLIALVLENNLIVPGHLGPQDPRLPLQSSPWIGRQRVQPCYAPSIAKFPEPRL